MKVQIAKWGHSLAIRIPGECVRQARIKAGDDLEIEVTASGDLHLRPVLNEPFDKSAFLERIQTFRSGIPESEPVVAVMRQRDRY